jgi:hypothetical protein
MRFGEPESVAAISACILEVTAATLYEAVGQGLADIRGNEWVAGIARGLNVVKVSVADVRSSMRSIWGILRSGRTGRAVTTQGE